MTQIGYCTNIHAGTDVPSILKNLREISARVRSLTIDHSTDWLGVGLWIPRLAAQQLTTDAAQMQRMSETLVELQLMPMTINGFPFSNFHQDVVKHDVYLPGWWDDARLDYTQDLTIILHQLLLAFGQPDQVASISTLPLGWPDDDTGVNDERMRAAAKNLANMADFLHRQEQETGRRTVIAIEPEPGCMLDCTDDMLTFFDRFLSGPRQRRYLTVCHDVCHSAVMFESQEDTLLHYAGAGIEIGKVQVSSAIDLPLQDLDRPQRLAAIEQLQLFAEDRYLHQTGLKRGAQFELVPDLPIALEQLRQDPLIDHARVHFHVPIHIDAFDHLSTTRDDVRAAIQTLSSDRWQSMQSIGAAAFTGHYEVETYAWSVLPQHLKTADTAENIAQELRYAKQLISKG